VAAAPTTSAVAVRVRLTVILAIGGCRDAIAVHPSKNGSDEEEDAVHDAESPAGLEHSARLLRLPVPIRGRDTADAAEVDGPVGVAADGGAVDAADEA
jgi:hypothetical protein